MMERNPSALARDLIAMGLRALIAAQYPRITHIDFVCQPKRLGADFVKSRAS